MTKKRNLKIAAKKDERPAEACECGKGACSCGCNCQAKVAVLAGTALAVVLSVIACVKSCTCGVDDGAIETYIIICFGDIVICFILIICRIRRDFQIHKKLRLVLT